MHIGMGLDGGGTKTDCVLMQDDGRILGRGRGAASNPSRIGMEAAASGVMEAANAALNDAGLQMEQVTSVCVGLAGVADSTRAASMKKILSEVFRGKNLELCTDLDLALAFAGSRSAIVLVAGTGSAAIGRDSNGLVSRSGGHGPKKSDEGSAFAIGKSTVKVLQVAVSKEAKDLRERVQEQLGVETLETVAGIEGEKADTIYPRVFPVLANAADEGNKTAQDLLNRAAASLTELVADVQRELNLDGQKFLLGKIGGMIGRSRHFDDTLDRELRKIAPRAEIEILRTPLAEMAARRALTL